MSQMPRTGVAMCVQYRPPWLLPIPTFCAARAAWPSPGELPAVHGRNNAERSTPQEPTQTCRAVPGFAGQQEPLIESAASIPSPPAPAEYDGIEYAALPVMGPHILRCQAK
jgi:hypothetical protein